MQERNSATKSVLIEKFSTIMRNLSSPFRLNSEEANRKFTEQLELLNAPNDPARNNEDATTVLGQLQAEASRRGVKLFCPDDEQIKELSRLTFSQIESRLGITKKDNFLGRHALGFPLDEP